MSKGMLKTAIEMFLGERLVLIEDGDDVSFVTATGHEGVVAPNFVGNLDIWVGEEVVYEVEIELAPILDHSDDYQLFDLYDYIRSIDRGLLKYKSQVFLDVVGRSVENILLNMNLPLEGHAVIGCNEVICVNSQKFLISLN
jgi:hypothetical protein